MNDTLFGLYEIDNDDIIKFIEKTFNRDEVTLMMNRITYKRFLKNNFPIEDYDYRIINCDNDKDFIFVIPNPKDKPIRMVFEND